MAVSTLLGFVFPPPRSLFVTVMSVVSLTSLANTGFSEIRGKHLKYSKFWNSGETSSSKQIKLSGRNGMATLYAPAFLAALASFVVVPDNTSRVLLLKSALTVHFLKRIIEVLFVHKFSANVVLEDAMVISLSYFISTASIIYAQHLSAGLPEPHVNLVYPGIALFLIGISGNFYHHFLLSSLRKKNDRGYKIPKGGLFDIVICPHYLFEILGFVGVSFISQTLYSFCFTLGTTFYLMGRSYATKRWYLSKFEDFPKDRKVLIPFVF